MGIPQKMESTVRIKVRNARLTKFKKLTVDIKQDGFARSYTPVVVSDEIMAFTIPIEDAMQLNEKRTVTWQILGKDERGKNVYNREKQERIDHILRGGEW